MKRFYQFMLILFAATNFCYAGDTKTRYEFNLQGTSNRKNYHSYLEVDGKRIYVIKKFQKNKITDIDRQILYIGAVRDILNSLGKEPYVRGKDEKFISTRNVYNGRQVFRKDNVIYICSKEFTMRNNKQVRSFIEALDKIANNYGL
ncbi:MAG: hypothetical protein MK193_02665 [Lentisphaeria bacterium]|nr:hypothetical protein [Lentisphaeria bacterium]